MGYGHTFMLDRFTVLTYAALALFTGAGSRITGTSAVLSKDQAAVIVDDGGWKSRVRSGTISEAGGRSKMNSRRNFLAAGAAGALAVASAQNTASTLDRLVKSQSDPKRRI